MNTHMDLEKFRDERVITERQSKKLYGDIPIFLKNLSIPKINKGELLKIYDRVKPIYTYNNEKYNLRIFEASELKTKSYTWVRENDLNGLIDMNHLYAVGDFPCLHKNDNGVFSPTIAEVLSQIPSSLVEKVDAFEIIEYPETTRDIEMYPDIKEKGYYLSLVRTYTII